MNRGCILFLSTLLASTQCACGLQKVAAPRAPEASMPDIEELPPAGGGLARVVIGTDVPALVERITHRNANPRTAQAPASAYGGEVLLCAETPCAVTLPYGDYELAFKGTRDSERSGHVLLVVRRETVVLNHTLGRTHRPAGQGVAWALAMTGALLLGVAYGLADSQRLSRSTVAAAPSVAVAGLGTMLLGGIVGLASPGTHQEGSSTQWSPQGPTAGVTVGVRF